MDSSIHVLSHQPETKSNKARRTPSFEQYMIGMHFGECVAHLSFSVMDVVIPFPRLLTAQNHREDDC